MALCAQQEETMSRLANLTPVDLGTNPHAIDDTAPLYDPRLQYGVTRDAILRGSASTQTTQTFDSKGQPKDMDHDK
jgi:hypothetical protein